MQPASQLAQLLVDSWPALTPNLHRLSFDDGRVELLLGFGQLDAWLPAIVAQVDAFFLDVTATRPSADKASSSRFFRSLARLAAPLATVDIEGVAFVDPNALTAAGFRLGGPGDDDVARSDASPLSASTQCPTNAGTQQAAKVVSAIFDPRFTPKRPPARPRQAPPARHHAVIIGAGLAGCATAWALAQQGWTATIVDRQPAPASETSGNPGGLFHGIVNAQDGTHARFNRAAAMEASKAVRIAIDEQGIRGQVEGLLRLETSLADVKQMQAILTALHLPSDYALAIDAAEGSVRSGLPLSQPGWWYAQGGWVDPAGLARSFLQRAGHAVTFKGGLMAARLEAADGGWRVLDESGRLIEQCETVVLANANDAATLLEASAASSTSTAPTPPQSEPRDRAGAIDDEAATRRANVPSPAFPTTSTRGQISLIRASPGLRDPGVPVAGAGYALPASNGYILTGATSHESDGEPALRLADHQQNLEQLKALTCSTFDTAAAPLAGRVGWRCVTPDRLPLIGAVASANIRHGEKTTTTARLEQVRMVPREPGLFVFTGLGSRGITWSALGARILASWITGAPFPVEASLVDAVDAARFVSRAARG